MPPDTSLLAGRYRLASVLGDGGMGRVWEAYDENLGRTVAVKEVLFPPQMSARDRVAQSERTMREARLTAQLNHPAVVTTYDAVEHDGRPYIVMEMVPSVSLAEQVSRHGPLSAEAVRRIGLTLVDALSVAHRQGIVHRDVKPSNLLLAHDDRVLLSDFGIATRESDPALTTTGLLIGSPAYMSPERLRGDRATFAADVWSLGATLYNALEGHPPFRAETTMGTITSILADEVEPPRADGSLGEAVAGMLVKDPAQRLTLEQVGRLLRRAPRESEPAIAAAPPPASDEPAAPAPTRDEPVAPPPTREEPDSTPAWWEQPPLAGSPAPARSTSRAPVVALVVAAVLVVALGVAAAMWISGPDDEAATPPAASASRPESPPASQPSPEQSSTEEGSPAPTPRSRALPQGYRMHQDPLGFRVAVPRGWERRMDSPTRVDFVAPDGSRFLRVDQREDALPDAAEAWRDSEPAVADSLPGYQRIRIDPVPHPRWDVADWEFTWEGGAGTVRVLNRGIATDTRGFALYVSAPDATWNTDGEPVVAVVSESFQPTR